MKQADSVHRLELFYRPLRFDCESDGLGNDTLSWVHELVDCSVGP